MFSEPQLLHSALSSHKIGRRQAVLPMLSWSYGFKVLDIMWNSGSAVIIAIIEVVASLRSWVIPPRRTGRAVPWTRSLAAQKFPGSWTWRCVFGFSLVASLSRVRFRSRSRGSAHSSTSNRKIIQSNGSKYDPTLSYKMKTECIGWLIKEPK